jgi:hypothetical protein
MVKVVGMKHKLTAGVAPEDAKMKIFSENSLF